MHLENSQNKLFLKQLIYFGANLSFEEDLSEMKSHFQDMELFVVTATLQLSWNVRITHSFLSWLKRYSPLLCPSKMRRLFKITKYNPDMLGVLVALIKENDPRPKRWDILKPYFKKNSGKILFFPHIPKPFGDIDVRKMSFDFEKYLLPKKTVLNSCPEIKNRALMSGVLSADVLTAVRKQPELTTSYQIAKITHHHRAQVHMVLKISKQVGYVLL